MKLQIFSWNVRGLNNMDTKRNLVRSRIQQEGVNIIVLVETKLRGGGRGICATVGGKQMDGRNVDGIFSAVYASYDGRERNELWEEFGAMRSFCRDFNTTRFPSEKTNCSRIFEAMSDFFSYINELELVDPPLFGGPYRWRRGK
ncbi:hypothetical protein H5410_050529 [Solanum commersonii]|uniref:Endonuclease/exonuclease/phosphatase domain-containing protein n=1 Tax=Solanum commersonii TaxID=4109 RepID=A0A9J5WY60_SOLCO|nr:hypothetical protein H5410_050529 [Solanum commersonii]